MMFLLSIFVALIGVLSLFFFPIACSQIIPSSLSTSRFQIGDKVKCISRTCGSKMKKDNQGEIIGDDKKEYKPYKVRLLSNGEFEYCDQKDLQKVPDGEPVLPTPSPSPSYSPSPTPPSPTPILPKNKDCDFVWDLIKSPDNAKSQSDLNNELNKLGVSDGDVLQYCEDIDIASLNRTLKIVPGRMLSMIFVEDGAKSMKSGSQKSSAVAPAGGRATYNNAFKIITNYDDHALNPETMKNHLHKISLAESEDINILLDVAPKKWEATLKKLKPCPAAIAKMPDGSTPMHKCVKLLDNRNTVAYKEASKAWDVLKESKYCSSPIMVTDFKNQYGMKDASSLMYLLSTEREKIADYLKEVPKRVFMKYTSSLPWLSGSNTGAVATVGTNKALQIDKKDFQSFYQILQTESNAKNPKALLNELETMGLYDAYWMEYLNEGDIKTLGNFLKPVPLRMIFEPKQARNCEDVWKILNDKHHSKDFSKLKGQLHEYGVSSHIHLDYLERTEINALLEMLNTIPCYKFSKFFDDKSDKELCDDNDDEDLDL